MVSQPSKFYKKYWSGIVFGLLTVGLGVKLYPFAKLHQAIFIVSLCILLFAFAVTYGLKFVLSNGESHNGSWRSLIKQHKYEFGLILIVILTTLPVLIKSYFYYDDWVLIGNANFPCKINLYIHGRPIHTLLFAILDKADITNAYVFKWFFLGAILLYALVLYRWLYQRSHNEKFAFFMSGLLSVFAPIMDVIGYTATGIIVYAFLFSALSVVAFDVAYQAIQRRAIKPAIIHTGISFLLLFTACLTYQLGTHIVFLLLAMELFLAQNPKQMVKKHFIFLLVFSFSLGFYLLFLNTSIRINALEIIANRSQVINSLELVVEKFQFYQYVLKQSIMQVGAALSGNAFLLERYHGYTITYSSELAARLINPAIIGLILCAFAGYYLKTKSILGLIVSALYLPMSYFSFLVLAESGYLTHYAFAHISILMFFFMMGLIAIFKVSGRVYRKIRRRETALPSGKALYLVLVAILLFSAWISNRYARDFYVNYNTQLYDYIKDRIQSALASNELDRIHTIGLITPINADIYSLLVVQTALKDLGENIDEYNLTYSSNARYMGRIEEFYYQELVKGLSPEDLSFLESFYDYVPTYSQYNINRIPSREEEALLADIFCRSGAIPPISSSTTLLIDLTWTYTAYYNEH
jgi:hypothetical protein